MPAAPEPSGSSPEEALRRLEQRLDRASEAAERLMAQAAAQAAAVAARAGDPTPAGEGARGRENPGPRGGENPGAGAGDPLTPPPAGWQAAGDEARESTSELDPLVALAQAMRDLVPPDLQRRLVAAIREVLLALRALIDWYLERFERQREQGVEVQDIPIL